MSHRSLSWSLLVALGLQGCKAPDNGESRLQWGVHKQARTANVLNLLPNQSVEVCADRQDFVAGVQEAIRKWASAIDRVDHIKINNCGQTSDLTIRLYEGAPVNHYNARPGKIFLPASASGPLLRAYALHEVGHSFGLCDQYRDVGAASCSDARSERQQNNEVMGATTKEKLNLTLGDIEGVRTAASDMSIRANKQWHTYLLNVKPKQAQSQQQNPSRKVFARVAAGATKERSKLMISVPIGSSVAVCRFQSGQTSCAAQSPQAISMQKINGADGREFYESTQDISGPAAPAETLTFIVTIRDASGISTEKFAIRRK